MAVQNSFLSPLGYQLAIKKLPNTVLNVTSVTLPGITVEDAQVLTPFKTLWYPDKVVYNDFVVRFKVNESMADYREIFDWMVAIGRPSEFSPPNISPNFPSDIYREFTSDATLIILNSANKPNIEVRFQDLFPIALSDLEFTSQDTDVSYIDATANFRCLQFTFHTI